MQKTPLAASQKPEFSHNRRPNLSPGDGWEYAFYAPESILPKSLPSARRSATDSCE